MRVEVLGEGNPGHAVVSCVHGDEVTGWKAIQKFKESGHELKKPVKFILANEKAYENDHAKSIDTDLNRCFPGDPESKNHEERLAPRLDEEIEGLRVLDIHTTKSEVTPFAVIVGDDEETLEMLEEVSMDKAINFSGVDGAMISREAAVSVEFEQWADESVEKAYQAILNFLAGEGVIEGKTERKMPEIFEVFDTAEGESYKFLGTNFEKIREGEVFAEKKDEKRAAEEDFYPVLMSTEGYPDKIGYKARKLDI